MKKNTSKQKPYVRVIAIIIVALMLLSPLMALLTM